MNVTAIIVNFNTLHLVKQAYESLQRAYPDLPVILVDNNSQDGSRQWMRERGGIVLSHNIGHGPALHLATMHVKTPYFLTLDSDCIVNKDGFLEGMLPFFESGANTYATGWLRWMHRTTGIPHDWHIAGTSTDDFVQYVHPAVGLFNREKYLTLKPFSHHGSPLLDNMLDAEAHGYQVGGFPVFDYITHLIGGTRRMYKNWWDVGDAKPDQWKPDITMPG